MCNKIHAYNMKAEGDFKIYNKSKCIFLGKQNETIIDVLREGI